MAALIPFFGARTQRQIISAMRGSGVDSLDFDAVSRTDRYAFNRAMLNNTAYRLENRGGFRELILKQTFDEDNCADENRIIGAYNPVRNIVDAYQNVFRGNYGQEIKVDEKVDERPVNPKLSDTKESPIRKLWKWSNLDTNKQVMQEWAANLGTTGLRIVASDNTDKTLARVSVQIDHPATIFDFNEDDRGNVTEVELKYTVMAGDLGQPKEETEVREVLTKTEFVKEVGGKNVLEADQRKNNLGVCPYVVLRHRDDGHAFGCWAYHGSEEIIHWLNWIICNQGESIKEHAWPQWFAAAGGKRPEEFDLGKRKVAYVQQDKDTPPPIFAPLVAPLDHAGALAYLLELMTRLQERQPEIAIGNVKALSGQSGETIAKLLIPAEAAILRARAQYEHALIRALQIGLSQGVLMSLWDIGSGMGSADAADAAYRTGLEDFAFAERSALPETLFDQAQRATAETAKRSKNIADAKAATGILDQQTTLEHVMGFPPAQAQEVLKRKRTQDSIPTEGL